MSRRGRIVLGVIGAGLVALVLFDLSRLKVTPPAVDPSGISVDVVRRGPLLRETAGSAASAGVESVLYIERPAHAEPHRSRGVFKLIYDGGEAARVKVKFGRASANRIEVLNGLKEGDRVVISDMSAWDQFDRIRIK